MMGAEIWAARRWPGLTSWSAEMRGRVFLTVVVVSVLALPATAISKSRFSPWAEPVQVVDPKISEQISVFRQTDPAPARPDFITEIYKARKDGKTLDGGNPELARPAYPDVERKQPPVWLVPGANGYMYAWSDSGKGASGTGGPTDDEYFRKYGWVSVSGSRIRNRSYSQVTVVVPDSIATVRLVFQRRSGKRFARDFTPHDNVVVNTDRRIRAVIINGKRFKFQPMREIFRKR